MDIEGLVLHIVWGKTAYKTKKAVLDWEKLVNDAKAPLVKSGLLQLSIIIYNRIAKAVDVPIREMVDYVTGHDDAWYFSDTFADKVDVTGADWERDIASLDSSILALLDAETKDDKITPSLEGSLFSRQIQKKAEGLPCCRHWTNSRAVLGF